MDQIHNNLLQSSKGYAAWHEHPHHKKVHWISFVIIIGLLFFLMMGIVGGLKKSAQNYVSVGTPAGGTAALTLDPKEKSVKVGDSFAVNIMLDTDNKPVDGVDVYSLHYDPTILSVVDDSTSKAGVQITAGTLMSMNIINSVDAKTGTIKFSEAQAPGSSFTGKGILATIHFKAQARGSSYLKFDFTLGSTTDTNVAHVGRDQLANVVDAIYTVNPK